MQNRENLYCTPGAAHCIDLMLGDFGKKIPFYQETIACGKKITTYIYSRTDLISLSHKFTKGTYLIRQINTCFATSYLTLGGLDENKRSLIRMFTFKEWKFTQFEKTTNGGFVENLILDQI